MDAIVARYGLLLEEVDEWFARASGHDGSSLSCRMGCSECCRGLFDITLLDAFYLKNGFDGLPPDVQKTVAAKARQRLEGLRTLWPEFSLPYILNYRPEDDWDELMPEEDETPCPLLGDEGCCLLYAYRPMTCRLNGVPLVDLSGEIFFDEWCTLNFVGKNPMAMEELRGDFRRIFAEELSLFREFTSELLKHRLNELDTFIPTALLVDFRTFDWPSWLMGTRLVENPLHCD